MGYIAEVVTKFDNSKQKRLDNDFSLKNQTRNLRQDRADRLMDTGGKPEEKVKMMYKTVVIPKTVEYETPELDPRLFPARAASESVISFNKGSSGRRLL